MTADDEIVASLAQYLEAEDERIEHALALLYGELPVWIPEAKIDQIRRIVGALLHDFTPELIARFVDEEERGELIPPGVVRDFGAFNRDINELLHVHYAISKGESEGLRILSGRDAAIGRNTRRTQSEKAKKSRGKVGDDGTTINEIIGGLALMRAHRELTAKELWPHFFDALNQRGLDPSDEDNREDWKKSAYEYAFKDGRKQITGGQFANVVSDFRTGRKSG
jgi:hypothetical protein